MSSTGWERKMIKMCDKHELRRYLLLENTFLFWNFVEVNLLICQNEWSSKKVSKSCSWLNKVVHGRPSIKWISCKGSYVLLKVDKMYNLLKKIPLEMVNRWKKKGMIKIVNGFYIELPIYLLLR